MRCRVCYFHICESSKQTEKARREEKKEYEN